MAQMTSMRFRPRQNFIRSSWRGCDDVIGLYLTPPDKALVSRVDGRIQCQALKRSQPMFTMGLSHVERPADDHLHPLVPRKIQR